MFVFLHKIKYTIMKSNFKALVKDQFQKAVCTSRELKGSKLYSVNSDDKKLSDSFYVAHDAWEDAYYTHVKNNEE